MSQLGACAAVGVSPLDVIRADPAERSLLLACAVEARDWIEQRDEALANRIISALAEALKKGKRG